MYLFMNEIVKWFTTLFLIATTTLGINSPKGNITPTPTPIISTMEEAWKILDENEFNCPARNNVLDWLKSSINKNSISSKEESGKAKDNNRNLWACYILSVETNDASQQSQYNPPTIDADPVIDCNFTNIGTMRLKSSVCSKSTDCQIGDKWIYYDSVDKCKQDQKAYQDKKGEEYQRQLKEEKINCSYTASGYSFNFGQLTSDECKLKYNQYFDELDQKRNERMQKMNEYYDNLDKEMQKQANPTTIPVVNNTELREECLGEVSSAYQSEITRLNIDRPNGSAYINSKNEIDRKYKSLEQNCKNRYPVN